MANSKGWKRLKIALGVPYFGVWALMLVANTINSIRAFEEQAKNKAAGNAFLASVNNVGVNLNVENIILAITWGIVVPAIVFIVWVVARWVYRGFSSSKT